MYQDDIIFGSNSFEDMCEKLEKILQILKNLIPSFPELIQSLT